jgi:hypothetical protein
MVIVVGQTVGFHYVIISIGNYHSNLQPVTAVLGCSQL